jgi:hypothetical protein
MGIDVLEIALLAHALDEHGADHAPPSNQSYLHDDLV